MGAPERSDLEAIISSIRLNCIDIGMNSARCIHELNKAVGKLDPKLGHELLDGAYGRAMDNLLSALEALQKRHQK